VKNVRGTNKLAAPEQENQRKCLRDRRQLVIPAVLEKKLSFVRLCLCVALRSLAHSSGPALNFSRKLSIYFGLVVPN
jgi:hypothetical protein